QTSASIAKESRKNGVLSLCSHLVICSFYSGGNAQGGAIPPVEGVSGGGTAYGWNDSGGLHFSNDLRRTIDPTKVPSAELLHVWSMPSTANVGCQEMPRPLHPITLLAARNERENVQICIRPKVSWGGPGVAGAVQVHCTDLCSTSGDRLTVGESLTLRRVVPILGVPDALVPLDLPLTQINLFPGDTTSIWVSIDVPTGQPPGQYEGKIFITAMKTNEESLTQGSAASAKADRHQIYREISNYLDNVEPIDGRPLEDVVERVKSATAALRRALRATSFVECSSDNGPVDMMEDDSYTNLSVCTKLRLTVWDFILPVTPSLPAVFGISETVIEDRYGVEHGSTDWYAALDQHFKWLLRYRISPFFCRWGDSMRVLAYTCPWPGVVVDTDHNLSWAYRTWRTPRGLDADVESIDKFADSRDDDSFAGNTDPRGVRRDSTPKDKLVATEVMRTDTGYAYITDWASMRRELLYRFIPISYEDDSFTKLQSLRQKPKTVDEYTNEFCILSFRVAKFETGAQKVNRFKTSLSKKNQDELTIVNVYSIAEAVAMAKDDKFNIYNCGKTSSTFTIVPLNLEQYESIRNMSNEIRTYAPDARVLTTYYSGPSDAPLGSTHFEAFIKVPEFLRPHTQIYCTSEWVLGNREDLVKDIVAELQPENGEEWWTYVCLGPTDPHPNWHLGMKGTQHRAVMWRVWKEGGTGFLYWGSNCYEKATIASAEIRFRHGLPPGDGVLFYPGEVFSSALHQLVASVRLERILSGLQDIEYLKLYTSRYGRDESLALLEKTGVYLGPERYTHDHLPIDILRGEIFSACRSS
ncbi:hypothetical protein GIB67_017452, partial [Kingdonia uniflora]